MAAMRTLLYRGLATWLLVALLAVAASFAPVATAADGPDANWHRLSTFATPILSTAPGRVHNIQKAVGKLNGRQLEPGQDFSYNRLLGPRDAQFGWELGTEVHGDKLVPGYGGGICQVVTTLYNAVLLAGLEVTERHRHNLAADYIPPGRDATVFWNHLDFRFRNNLGMPIRISARVRPGEPQQVELSLWGPKPLPEPIRIQAVDLKVLPPELDEIVDDNLPAGQRQVIDEGAAGFDVTIYRLHGAGEQQRRELISHDHYRPRRGKVRVGAGGKQEGAPPIMPRLP